MEIAQAQPRGHQDAVSHHAKKMPKVAHNPRRLVDHRHGPRRDGDAGADQDPAALAQVAQRLLLPEDAGVLMERAEQTGIRTAP
jgi:hypothetical protein